jgi:hypothetical protein
MKDKDSFISPINYSILIVMVIIILGLIAEYK